MGHFHYRPSLHQSFFIGSDMIVLYIVASLWLYYQALPPYHLDAPLRMYFGLNSSSTSFNSLPLVILYFAAGFTQPLKAINPLQITLVASQPLLKNWPPLVTVLQMKIMFYSQSMANLQTLKHSWQPLRFSFSTFLHRSACQATSSWVMSSYLLGTTTNFTWSCSCRLYPLHWKRMRAERGCYGHIITSQSSPGNMSFGSLNL